MFYWINRIYLVLKNLKLKYNIDLRWSYSVTDIEDNNWTSRDSEEYYGFSLNINDIDMLIDDIVNIFK